MVRRIPRMYSERCGLSKTVLHTGYKSDFRDGHPDGGDLGRLGQSHHRHRLFTRWPYQEWTLCDELQQPAGRHLQFSCRRSQCRFRRWPRQNSLRAISASINSCKWSRVAAVKSFLSIEPGSAALALSRCRLKHERGHSTRMTSRQEPSFLTLDTGQFPHHGTGHSQREWRRNDLS